MKQRVSTNLFKQSARRASLIFCACLLAAAAVPTLWAAAYFPPDSGAGAQGEKSFEGEWLADFKGRDDGKVQFTLRYEERKGNSTDGWNFNNWSSSNGIAPDQLQGLTREQAMST